MVLSASAKSPCHIQIPNKTRDEWGTCGGKYARVPQLLLPLLLPLGSERQCLKGARVEVAGKYVSLEDHPAFLSLWCSIFRKQIQGLFFVLCRKGTLVAETNCPRNCGYVRPQKC